MQNRRAQFDVSDNVQLSHPFEVSQEVVRLISSLYPDTDVRPIAHAYLTFTQMFTGTHPDVHGCDTWYHDAQHSLDTSLAMARLISGYERSVKSAEQLGGHRAVLGIIIALFHDIGYLRDRDDDSVKNGAEFTLTHVARGASFLRDYLPTVGFESDAELSARLIHYTGFEMPLDDIDVTDDKDRRVGYFLGTADLLAQMSDRCYLEKARDYLYREFEVCGIAGKPQPGAPEPLYSSPEDLLEKSPNFNKMMWEQRLDGYFEESYRYLEPIFEGRNLYTEEIHNHMRHLTDLLEHHDFSKLRRSPPCINEVELKRILQPNGNGAASD